MIPVREARARILASLTPVAAETGALAEAWNRVLAAPVVARRTQPPADVSAMDGWAVRAADAVAGAWLRRIGSAPAGHPFAGTIGPGETVRLFTGSVVPDGADAILMQENAEEYEGGMTVREAAIAGRHIRRAGQVDDAAVRAGRDPGSIKRTTAVYVTREAGSAHRLGTEVTTGISGTPAEIAAQLRTIATAGIDEAMSVPDPNTVESIAWFAPVLEELDCA